MPSQLSYDDYTVGWISALPLELAAARAVLDETREPLPAKEGDYNVYAYGRISEHNVVIACLPAGLIGTNSAASVAMQMHRSFSRLRFGLMVGIGGGVPSKDHDIRLGDVVISQPGNGYGGVVQYDFGKSRPYGLERIGFLNSPPTALLSAVSMLRTTQEAVEVASGMLNGESLATASRPPSDSDVLYSANTDDAAPRVVDRPPRPSPGVQVHYGTVASGNQVMRDAVERDKVSRELGGVLCFEMEAAGLMNTFRCLVIRGICDYSDAHKTKKWQQFAAATAAVYTKQLLAVLPKAGALSNETLPDDRIVSLPFQRNHKFVGRHDVLRELKRRLLFDEECQEIALFGLGGIGKTQIVLEFANMLSETRPDMTIFWVVCLSEATIEKSFLEIAGQLKLGLSSGSTEDTKDVVKRHLENSCSRPWLMVVDNVDDENLVDLLLGCLPHGKAGYKLYTSRSTRVVQDLVGGDAIEVQPLDEAEGLRLMRKSLLKYNSDQHESDITALCEDLEFLPLALTQAAAYMNQNLVTPAKYRELMKGADQDLVRLMSVENRDRTRYQQVGHAVATTWVVSFNQILENHPEAADILQFLSCVECREIPLSMLPRQGSAVEFASAIGVLRAYSLLVPSTNEDMYDMHRLVHLATRLWVNERGDTRALYTDALIHMESTLPTSVEKRDVWRVILPHATCMLRRCDGAKPDTQAELCYAVGCCLFCDARYKEATHWLETSQQLFMGPEFESTRVLPVQEVLAIIYRICDQESRAIELLEHVVAEYRSNAQEQEGDRLPAKVLLAKMYSQRGQVEEGVLMLEQVVSTVHPVKDQATLLRCQVELGRAYVNQGQIQKATDLLEHVEACQKHRVETDLDLIAVRRALSRAYLADGSDERATKAVQHLEHINNVVSAMFRPGHAGRLAVQEELAEAYLIEGKPGSSLRAIRLLESAVEIQSATRGPGDLSLLHSKRRLIKAYLDVDPKHHASKLVKVLEQVVQIESQTLKQDDPSRIRNKFNLGKAYSWVGDMASVASAVDTLEHAIQIGSEVFEKHDVSLLESRVVLAKMYLKLDGRDNPARAVSILEDVMHTKSQVFEEDSTDRLYTEHELASAYLRLKRRDATLKAVKLLEHVIAIEAKVLEEDDPARLAAQHELARSYLRLNTEDAASKSVKLWDYVINIEAKVLKEDDPGRLVDQHALARGYLGLKTGDATSKAVKLLKHVTNITSQVLKEDDPSRLLSEHSLAEAYLRTRDPRATSMAIELLEHMVQVNGDTLKNDESASGVSRDLLHNAYEIRQYVQQVTDSESSEEAPTANDRREAGD